VKRQRQYLVAARVAQDNNQVASRDISLRARTVRAVNAGRRWENAVAGYSGTPLWKKLGIKAGTVLHAVHAPADYAALLGPLPENATIALKAGKRELDLVHIFTKSRSELLDLLMRFRGRIKQEGAIWVSWPKRASKIPSDITEDTVRELALPQGLVDIKVCAVDDVWSGLKLVIRKENRT
jgi:Protein of unknown function (DUF3052)